MSLVQALSSPPSQLRIKPCLYARLRASLKPEEQEALDLAMEKVKEDKGAGSHRVYSVKWLVKVLRSEGFNLSEATIARHKNGSCSCGTD